MADVTRVKRARTRRAASEEEFRAAIRDAVERGVSLREVGKAAGVAHTRVLQIVRGR
jgi:hypothetical protein